MPPLLSPNSNSGFQASLPQLETIANGEAAGNLPPAKLPAAEELQTDGGHRVAHIDLALSGGGFRATLFHLGVMGFLRGQGLLPMVRNICSVSGGSILAAHMVTRWEEYKGPDDEIFVKAAKHLINAIQQDDVSGRTLKRWRSLRRGLLLKALDSELLVEEYRRILGSTKNDAEAKPRQEANGDSQGDQITRWSDLKEDDSNLPDLHLLATHLTSGTMCVFNKEGFSISLRTDDPKLTKADIQGLKEFARDVDIMGEDIARGVAASSAFPPLFAPLPPTGGDDSRLHLLTDGGVYDNSGVKHLRQLYEKENWKSERDRLVIVSDAGRTFSSKLGKRFDAIVELATRVSDAQGNRIAEFDTDETHEFFKKHNIPVLRCSIHKRIKNPRPPNNHSTIVQQRLSEIRTELDRFSDAEVFALYRHGYLVAQEQYASYCKEWQHTDWSPTGGPMWLPGGDALPKMKRDELEQRLLASHEMKKFSFLRKMLILFAALLLFIVVIFGVLLAQFLPPILGGSSLPKQPSTLRMQLSDPDPFLDQGDRWPHAYGSGLVYHKEIEGEHEFYMITDRGPAFDGPRARIGERESILKLYLDPNFAPRIAKVRWNKQANLPPQVVDSYELYKLNDHVNGLPPSPQFLGELTTFFERNKSIFEKKEPFGFGIDPEDIALSPTFEADGTFWICEEYRPSVMKAVLNHKRVEIQENVLTPGHGLPEEFKQGQPNRGLESISITNGWLFVAMQSACYSDANNTSLDNFIWIARARLDQVEAYVKQRDTLKPPQWEKFKYRIPGFYEQQGRGQCSIGGIQALDKDRLLVIEREVGTESTRRLINLVNLKGAVNGEVNPTLVLNLYTEVGWTSEKPEGISVVDEHTIAVCADNDFGLRLEGEIEVAIPGDATQRERLSITNMSSFQTVVLRDGNYQIMAKNSVLKSDRLSLLPRKGETATSFWIIHMPGSVTDLK